MRGDPRCEQEWDGDAQRCGSCSAALGPRDRNQERGTLEWAKTLIGVRASQNGQARFVLARARSTLTSGRAAAFVRRRDVRRQNDRRKAVTAGRGHGALSVSSQLVAGDRARECRHARVPGRRRGHASQPSRLSSQAGQVAALQIPHPPSTSGASAPAIRTQCAGASSLDSFRSRRKWQTVNLRLHPARWDGAWDRTLAELDGLLERVKRTSIRPGRRHVRTLSCHRRGSGAAASGQRLRRRSCDAQSARVWAVAPSRSELGGPAGDRKGRPTVAGASPLRHIATGMSFGNRPAATRHRAGRAACVTWGKWGMLQRGRGVLASLAGRWEEHCGRASRCLRRGDSVPGPLGGMGGPADPACTPVTPRRVTRLARW